MNTIFSLLKLQIDNQTDILKAAKPKTMALSIIKAVTILLLVTLGVSFALSRVFNLGFAINAPLLALILLITQLVSLAFGIGNVINTLYLCKDNEMLFCLPVAPNQLFISKILMIYIKELAVNTMITFPLLVTLGSFSSYGLSYYLSIPILLLVLPILPIVVAAFLSVPLMSIIGFLKKHALLSIISILLLVSACLYAYITLIGGMASEFNIANQQLETVVKINAAISEIGTKIPVYISLATAMTDFGVWYYFPIFLLLCVGVCSLTILFTRYFFFKIAMTSIEKTVKVKARVKKFKKRGAFHSLFLKELYCIFRSPTDIFEYFLFTLLMPFIVFSYDKLLMSITVNQAGTNMISGAHLMVVAILAMLSNISSASAVSRDGSNFHTSKIIPMSYHSQMFAKFTFNAVFTLGALALTALISLFIYPAWQILLGTVAVAMAAVGHIAYSIDTDIKNPTVNLQGNEESSTVSKSTSKSLIYGLVIGFVMGLIVILMSSMEEVWIPYVIIIVLSFIFMIYRVYTLALRINLCYDKIEM